MRDPDNFSDTPAPPARKRTTRAKNAEATRQNILEAALSEFARSGFSGARVDTIADMTQTSKRMIYYYFSNKEELYLAVLEESYKKIRAFETEVSLDEHSPVNALRKLVEATVDYQAGHPDFIRIIMNENILQGSNIERLPELRSVNSGAIDLLRRLCARGVDDGSFREDINPVDLHMNISALSFFNVSNRYTFGFIFDRDFSDPEVHAARREQIVESILRYVRAA